MTLWGGRFSTNLNAQAWELNSSLLVDQRLAIQDVDGSLAWAKALHQAGVLQDEEHATNRISFFDGLQRIENLIHIRFKRGTE